MSRTTCKIGKYKVWGDGPLPTLEIGVLADREGVIALNKPPCMYTFSGHFHLTGYPQLYDCIKAFWPHGAHAHRIDGTTSGVHMAGDGHDALSRIITGWRTRTHKEYLAIVSKNPPWDYIEITMEVVSNTNNWAPCTTGLTNLGDNLIRAALLDGGRTHQIRKALKAVGYPIVGDVLYGGEPAATRPLLHAWRCEIDGWGAACAPLPPDMEHAFTPDSPMYGAPDRPYLWSFEVKPITPKMQERLTEFRESSRGGVMPGWKWRPSRVFDGAGNEISRKDLKKLRAEISHSAG